MIYVSWGPGSKLRIALNGGAVSKSPAPGGLPSSTGSLLPLVVGPGAGNAGTRIDEVAIFPGRPNPATHFSPSALPVQQTPPVVSAPGSEPVKVGDTLTATPGIVEPGHDGDIRMAALRQHRRMPDDRGRHGFHLHRAAG